MSESMSISATQSIIPLFSVRLISGFRIEIITWRRISRIRSRYTASISQGYWRWWIGPEAERRANEIIAFETQGRRSKLDEWQQRDTIATYNPLTLGELENLAPNFAVARVPLAGAGISCRWNA